MVRFAMLNKNGEEEEVLCLPENLTTQQSGMDIDSAGEQGDDESDDPVTKTLTWIMGTAASGNLPMLEIMLV